jgi:hypothetical protein
MDLEEIKEMPEFAHNIDPYTYSKIPPEFKELAETISQLRQEVRWVGVHTVIAHNLSVQTARMFRNILIFVAITIAGWGIVEIVKTIWHVSG